MLKATIYVLCETLRHTLKIKNLAKLQHFYFSHLPFFSQLWGLYLLWNESPSSLPTSLHLVQVQTAHSLFQRKHQLQKVKNSQELHIWNKPLKKYLPLNCFNPLYIKPENVQQAENWWLGKFKLKCEKYLKL